MDNYLKDAFYILGKTRITELQKNIIYQERYLNTLNFNTTQNEVYAQLNGLYEKARVLEDVSSYIKEDMEQKIQNYTSNCKALLKEIEISRDKLKIATYNTVEIPLVNHDALPDRDTNILPMADIINGKICQNYIEKDNFNYKVSGEYSTKPYKNDLSALEKKLAYRVYYVTDTALKDGVKQRLDFTLLPSENVNMLDIKPSNCDCRDIRILSGKNVIDAEETHWRTPILTDQIQIFLVSKNFNHEIFYCDYNRIASDALSQLDNNLYKKMIDGKDLSLKEQEDLLGMTKYKQDYQKYIEQVNAWNKKRAEVAAENRKNGYEDSVPENTIISLADGVDLNVTIDKVSIDAEKPSTAKPSDQIGANSKTPSNDFLNRVIYTGNTVLDKNIITSNGNSKKIANYNWVNSIYPHAERYRFDFLNEKR